MKRVIDSVFYVMAAVVLLNLAACGKEQTQSAQLATMTQQTKCNSTVYVDDAGKAQWIPGVFQRACIMVFDSNGNPTVKPWNKLVQSGSDATCGFWLTDEGKLVTALNKELNLAGTTTYVPCEFYGL